MAIPSNLQMAVQRQTQMLLETRPKDLADEIIAGAITRMISDGLVLPDGQPAPSEVIEELYARRSAMLRRSGAGLKRRLDVAHAVHNGKIVVRVGGYA